MRSSGRWLYSQRRAETGDDWTAVFQGQFTVILWAHVCRLRAGIHPRGGILVLHGYITGITRH